MLDTGRLMAFTNPEPMSPYLALASIALFSLGMGLNVSADTFKSATKLAGGLPVLQRLTSCPLHCHAASSALITAGSMSCNSAAAGAPQHL